ncbi:MAG: glycogen debranching protein GlgX [bacterium]
MTEPLILGEPRVYPGAPYPLGATWDGNGVNFAVFSESARRVELCLYSADGRWEVARVELREQTDRVWHGYLPDARPGWLYGFRMDGRYEPAEGELFNRHKLLLDPYGKAVFGKVDWADEVFGYTVGAEIDVQDPRDDAVFMPKSVVIENAFSWGTDNHPRTPWSETLIYEAHIKGFSALNHRLPAGIRGTYRGLGDPQSIDYLKSLGITAVELMPVHHFLDDRHLVERGLSNYWGYNTIGFFAPEPRFGSSRVPGEVVNEFKSMVKALHEADIEVLLDVVYNHTGEGNQLGPTLSFRGIDNAAYYRLNPEDKQYYVDYTGTGNTLNMLHSRTIQMIMDSLRYWILDMHVDGFRFDLAATLARGLHEVDRLSAFFDIIHQDPVLSQVKLIAEPWDLGEGGYQVGNFPILWAEWNGKYRDCIRRFWKGDEGQLAELAYRLTGSSDLYASNGRRPYASINFVTAHDGFTLQDLVSYDEKHNADNGEENNDGNDYNMSWNHGAEGPTDDAQINELRARQVRNFIATLLISQGTPMLLHGDEAARSQGGNNNAYCQDNEISWMNWKEDEASKATLDWTRRIVEFRKRHPVLRRRGFFRGRAIRGSNVKDISWFREDATEMAEQDWEEAHRRALAIRLSGAASDLVDDRGNVLVDNSLLILLNASSEDVDFKLPADTGSSKWMLAFDSADPRIDAGSEAAAAAQTRKVTARSIAVFESSRRAQPNPPRT